MSIGLKFEVFKIMVLKPFFTLVNERFAPECASKNPSATPEQFFGFFLYISQDSTINTWGILIVISTDLYDALTHRV